MTTLTITGLTPGVPYSIRAGGINWNGVVNYAGDLSRA